MSNDEAIEILYDMRAGYNIFDTENDATRYHVLSWAIQAMKDGPGWIPVTERLPDEDGAYITTDTDGDVYQNYYYVKGMNNWHWMNGDAVAWMPLPEPYRGERMNTEEAIKIITEIKNIPHIDSMTNIRIDEALSIAIEALRDKLETEEKQSNW